jgi:hypothetical protein
MSNQLKTFAIAGALAASFLTPVAANAASIVGLIDGKTLVMIDPASKKVTSTVALKGTPGLLGIDVRPADGMLYGYSTDGNIVTIDPKSGQTTMKSKLSETVKADVVVTVDFNPVADRLRVMGSDGTSHRINVDDGKVTVDGSHKFKEGDANAGKTPKVIAGAYSNSFKGTTATALYNVDATTGVLVTQAPPNDGVLNTIGALGMKADGPVAFNVVSASADKNDAWLATGGNLYSVDLKTGKATMAGKLSGVSGKLTDIAWMD